MEQSAIITKYLGKLGVEPEAVAVYLELVRQGYSSALQLAKATTISRTQVYRHLEALQQFGLTSAEQLSYGTLYRPLPIDNIEGLLANREAETSAIRRNLGAMTAAMQAIAGGSGPKVAIQHYHGQAGIKQATWNLTKADGEYRCFEAAHLSTHLDQAFARRYRERCIERELTSYDLTNASVVRAKEIEPYEPKRTFLRHIDPGVLTINFEMLIYNQIVTLIDYKEQMAVEIHHPALHSMMKQLFDAMWVQASPLEVTQG
jgi:sugar-specific transcriptional regulator TrmB